MNTRQIQYAVELSKTLNFSQVAERLGISQPALSKQILSLENDLGVKLFDRTTVPMTLTAAGEHFIRQAQDLLYQEDQLLRSLEAYRTGQAGRLTIGISPFRSLYLLPEIVRKVKETFPDVQVILQEAGSDQLRQEAAEGKYDLAVVNLPVDEAVLDVVPLEPDTLVLAVPRRMAAGLPDTDPTAPACIDLKDCSELPFVTVGDQQEMRQLFDTACADARFHPNVTAEVVGLSTAWAMCRAGVGATLLPLQFVRHSGAEDVALYTLSQNLRTRQPVIITRRGQYRSPYAAYAISLLTAQAEGKD